MPSFKKPVFFIRVDGDDFLIGKGHLRRMGSLAVFLRQRHCRVIFLMRRSRAARICLAKSGFRIRWMPSEKSEEQIAARILSEIQREPGLKGLILDLREVDSWTIKAYLHPLVPLFVFHDRKIQGWNGNPKNVFLINCNRRVNRAYPFVLLSPAFSKIRKMRPAFPRAGARGIQLLISLGASDPGGGTCKVIRALMQDREPKTLHVVLPRYYAYQKELQKDLAKFPGKVRLYRDVERMTDLFRKVDAAIVSGGMTKYEIAQQGIPGIVLAQNAEQEILGREFCRHSGLIYGGSIKSFHPAVFVTHMARLRRKAMNDPSVRRRLRCGVDGKGAFRIAGVLSRFVKKVPRVVLLGNGRLAAIVLKVLTEHRIPVLAAVLPSGADWSSSKNPLVAAAQRRSIRILAPKKVHDSSELAKLIDQERPVLLSVDYDQILRSELLDPVRGAAFNFHPSLLPAYRGRAPLNWALIHGEKQVGVTLHWMNTGIDTGRIVFQKKIPVAQGEAVGRVLQKTERTYRSIAKDFAVVLKQGRIPGRTQSVRNASYYGKRNPEDGKIDWTCSAQSIHDLVRAVSEPYPGAFVMHPAKGKLVIWQTSLPFDPKVPDVQRRPGMLIGSERNRPCVMAGDGLCLEIKRLGYRKRILSGVQLKKFLMQNHIRTFS